MRPIPLVCVPFAGAGASFFYPWRALVNESFKIVALQPPGREQRVAEEPCRDVTCAVDGLLPDLVEEIRGAGPVVLFGHSLGAVLAYELGRRLAATPGVEVARLAVSGSPVPWTKRTRRATGLPDEEFYRRVQEFAGYSHPALEHPEMRELILPTLRADVEMHENYVCTTDTPVPMPIISIRGCADNLVTAEEAGEWVRATTRDFTLAEVNGGHMYLTDIDAAAQLLRLIAAATADC